MDARPDNPPGFIGTVDWRFAAMFLLYLTALLMIEQILSGYWGSSERTFTAYAAFRFWSLFSIPIVQRGPFIIFYDVPMEVTAECTALHYFAIFTAGVLAFRYHSRAYRLAGIVLGAVFVFSLNTIRLGILGLVAYYARDLYDIVHVYVWQGAFTLLMLLFWWAWMARTQSSVRLTVRKVLAAAAASLACLWLLDLAIVGYAAFLSVVLNAAGYLAAHLGALAVSVKHEGSVIATVTHRGTLRNDLFYLAINFVVLAAIAAVSALSRFGKIWAKRVTVSVVILCTQHMVFLFFYGMAITMGMDLETHKMMVRAASGLNMVTPLLAWFIACRLFPDRRERSATAPSAPRQV